MIFQPILRFPAILVLLAASIFFGGAISKQAAAESFKNLEITGAWIRATPPAAKVAGGFLEIANNGTSEDVLVAVDFAGANKSEIHQMEMNDGVMKMRQLADGVKISPAATVLLKPGGMHLMFMGLKNQLKDGERFPINLSFANAGQITVEFNVLSMKKGKKLMMQGN